MQTATGTIISGSAVTALAHLGSTFEPGDLDFIAGYGYGTLVFDFLDMARDYKLVDTPDANEYRFASGIARVCTMRHHDGQKINVFEALTENPFDVVGHFHLTCVYGAWSANGVLHCYPRLTASGIALTSPSKFPLGEGSKARINCWNILHKYTDRGFTVSLNEYDKPHTCGEDWNCPATLRTTDDAGCAYSPFPPWLYDDDTIAPSVSCWTLGGSGCSRGVLTRTDGTVVSLVASVQGMTVPWYPTDLNSLAFRIKQMLRGSSLCRRTLILPRLLHLSHQ